MYNRENVYFANTLMTLNGAEGRGSRKREFWLMVLAFSIWFVPAAILFWLTKDLCSPPHDQGLGGWGCGIPAGIAILLFIVGIIHFIIFGILRVINFKFTASASIVAALGFLIFNFASPLLLSIGMPVEFMELFAFRALLTVIFAIFVFEILRRVWQSKLKKDVMWVLLGAILALASFAVYVYLLAL